MWVEQKQFPPIVVATTILFEFVDWREFQIDAAMLANSPTYIVRLFSAITIQIRYVVLEVFELAGYGQKSLSSKIWSRRVQTLFGTIAGHSYGMFA